MTSAEIKLGTVLNMQSCKAMLAAEPLAAVSVCFKEIFGDSDTLVLKGCQELVCRV